MYCAYTSRLTSRRARRPPIASRRRCESWYRETILLDADFELPSYRESLSVPPECRRASVSITPRLPNSHGCDVRDRDRLRQRELLCGRSTRRWHRDYSQRLQSSEHTVSQSRDYPPPHAPGRTSHALAKDTGIAPPVLSPRP